MRNADGASSDANDRLKLEADLLDLVAEDAAPYQTANVSNGPHTAMRSEIGAVKLDPKWQKADLPEEGKTERRSVLGKFRQSDRYQKFLTSNRGRVPQMASQNPLARRSVLERMRPLLSAHDSANRRVMEDGRDALSQVKAEAVLSLGREGMKVENLFHLMAGRALLTEDIDSTADAIMLGLAEAGYDRLMIEVEVEEASNRVLIYLDEDVNERIGSIVQMLAHHGKAQVIERPDTNPGLGAYVVAVTARQAEHGMKNEAVKKPQQKFAPVCKFCGATGTGAEFNIFNPRFKPFGTACVDCEKSLPPDAQVPAASAPAAAKQESATTCMCGDSRADHNGSAGECSRCHCDGFESGPAKGEGAAPGPFEAFQVKLPLATCTKCKSTSVTLSEADGGTLSCGKCNYKVFLTEDEVAQFLSALIAESFPEDFQNTSEPVSESLEDLDATLVLQLAYASASYGVKGHFDLGRKAADKLRMAMSKARIDGWEDEAKKAAALGQQMAATDAGLKPVDQSGWPQWAKLESSTPIMDPGYDSNGRKVRVLGTAGNAQDIAARAKRGPVAWGDECAECQHMMDIHKPACRVCGCKPGGMTNESFTPDDIAKMKDAAQRTGQLIGLGAELKRLGFNASFSTHDAPMPAALITVSKGGSRYAICNKSYADDAEWVVGDIAGGKLESLHRTAQDPAFSIAESRLDKLRARLSEGVPEQHQLRIARDTLQMNDVGAAVMGGMTKAQARAFLKSQGWSDAKIAWLEDGSKTDTRAAHSMPKQNKPWGVADLSDLDYPGDKDESLVEHDFSLGDLVIVKADPGTVYTVHSVNDEGLPSEVYTLTAEGKPNVTARPAELVSAEDEMQTLDVGEVPAEDVDAEETTGETEMPDGELGEALSFRDIQRAAGVTGKAPSIASQLGALSPADMVRGTLIVSREHPEWGTWGVQDSAGEGMWEIRGDRGSKVLNQGELHFWRRAPGKQEGYAVFPDPHDVHGGPSPDKPQPKPTELKVGPSDKLKNEARSADSGDSREKPARISANELEVAPRNLPPKKGPATVEQPPVLPAKRETQRSVLSLGEVLIERKGRQPLRVTSLTERGVNVENLATGAARTYSTPALRQMFEERTLLRTSQMIDPKGTRWVRASFDTLRPKQLIEAWYNILPRTRRPPAAKVQDGVSVRKGMHCYEVVLAESYFTEACRVVHERFDAGLVTLAGPGRPVPQALPEKVKLVETLQRVPEAAVFVGFSAFHRDEAMTSARQFGEMLGMGTPFLNESGVPGFFVRGEHLLRVQQWMPMWGGAVLSSKGPFRKLTESEDTDAKEPTPEEKKAREKADLDAHKRSHPGSPPEGTSDEEYARVADSQQAEPFASFIERVEFLTHVSTFLRKQGKGKLAERMQRLIKTAMADAERNGVRTEALAAAKRGRALAEQGPIPTAKAESLLLQFETLDRQDLRALAEQGNAFGEDWSPDEKALAALRDAVDKGDAATVDRLLKQLRAAGHGEQAQKIVAAAMGTRHESLAESGNRSASVARAPLPSVKREDAPPPELPDLPTEEPPATTPGGHPLSADGVPGQPTGPADDPNMIPSIYAKARESARLQASGETQAVQAAEAALDKLLAKAHAAGKDEQAAAAEKQGRASIGPPPPPTAASTPPVSANPQGGVATEAQKNEASSGQFKLDALQKILSAKQVGEIDGTRIDLFTAGGLLGLYHSLRAENQQKFLAMPIEQMVETMMKLTQRQQGAFATSSVGESFDRKFESALQPVAPTGSHPVCEVFVGKAAAKQALGWLRGGLARVNRGLVVTETRTTGDRCGFLVSMKEANGNAAAMVPLVSAAARVACMGHLKGFKPLATAAAPAPVTESVTVMPVPGNRPPLAAQRVVEDMAAANDGATFTPDMVRAVARLEEKLRPARFGTAGNGAGVPMMPPETAPAPTVKPGGRLTESAADDLARQMAAGLEAAVTRGGRSAPLDTSAIDEGEGELVETNQNASGTTTIAKIPGSAGEAASRAKAAGFGNVHLDDAAWDLLLRLGKERESVDLAGMFGLPVACVDAVLGKPKGASTTDYKKTTAPSASGELATQGSGADKADVDAGSVPS